MQSNRSKRRDGFRRNLFAAGPPILRNQTRSNHPFYRPAEIRMCTDRAGAAPQGTIFVTDDPRPSREVGRGTHRGPGHGRCSWARPPRPGSMPECARGRRVRCTGAFLLAGRWDTTSPAASRPSGLILGSRGRRTSNTRATASRPLGGVHHQGERVNGVQAEFD